MSDFQTWLKANTKTIAQDNVTGKITSRDRPADEWYDNSHLDPKALEELWQQAEEAKALRHDLTAQTDITQAAMQECEEVKQAARCVTEFFYAFDEKLGTDAPDDTLLLGYWGDEASGKLTYGDLRRLRRALRE